RLDLLRVGLEILAHRRGVDHVRRGQVPAHGEDGFADLDRALTERLFLDHDSTLALDRASHPCAHPELRIGRVDDGVDLGVRDVATLERERGLPDLDLHRPGPEGSRGSRAFTVSHAWSSSSADASLTVRPRAFMSVSTSLKRRVNLSAA